MKNRAPYRTTERGFIALISTVVISAILIILMAEVGMASFFARFDAVGNESKRIALARAESCVNVGLLALATSTDPAHYTASDQIVTVDSDARGNPETCTVKTITHTGSTATISAYASFNNSYSTVSAQVSLPPDVHIISWSY